MPITIDEVVEKGKQRKQLLTLAEKHEIADQARGIGQQGQWYRTADNSSVLLHYRCRWEIEYKLLILIMIAIFSELLH